MRTHVVLPEDLVRQIDRLVGKRRRSEFLESAAGEKMQRLVLAQTLERGAGILRDINYPHWATPERVEAWLDELRHADVRRFHEPFPDGDQL